MSTIQLPADKQQQIQELNTLILDAYLLNSQFRDLCYRIYDCSSFEQGHLPDEFFNQITECVDSCSYLVAQIISDYVRSLKPE